VTSLRDAEFPDETTDDGDFRRQPSAFRDQVTADGSSGFRAAPGRYHLYVSYACPWAHRTLVVRALLGLEEAITVSVVDPIRDARGWRFSPDEPGCTPDHVNGFSFLRQAYEATDPQVAGRITVPVLWDRETGRIVNNESSEIIRMLNGAFRRWASSELDLYPRALRAEIDRLNERVYDDVNNGVYRCGFATSQRAYERAFVRLFDTLELLEGLLSQRRYLAGDRITEADWRLFTTLVRFDPVYVGHFKCNLRRLCDHPNLWAYTRELYQWPGVAETVHMDHIKRHYYVTHARINPSGIVALGPAIDFSAPHDRRRLTATDL
jgi:putative glutathione S-transferase